ncbi:hypothetical protein EJB06_20810 [Massilia atriviolacea]|uniref:Uncharacterized protein n=1 Tax=Massilia atriviolacea TaxID=2495579 RepID=A0A430HI25_9BURK|nr:hypothetical protein EJB06_20810 [Massilia atriviolacea]
MAQKFGAMRAMDEKSLPSMRRGRMRQGRWHSVGARGAACQGVGAGRGSGWTSGAGGVDEAAGWSGAGATGEAGGRRAARLLICVPRYRPWPTMPMNSVMAMPTHHFIMFVNARCNSTQGVDLFAQVGTHLFHPDADVSHVGLGSQGRQDGVETRFEHGEAAVHIAIIRRPPACCNGRTFAIGRLWPARHGIHTHRPSPVGTARAAPTSVGLYDCHSHAFLGHLVVNQTSVGRKELNARSTRWRWHSAVRRTIPRRRQRRVGNRQTRGEIVNLIADLASDLLCDLITQVNSETDHAKYDSHGRSPKPHHRLHQLTLHFLAQLPHFCTKPRPQFIHLPAQFGTLHGDCCAQFGALRGDFSAQFGT